MRIVLVMITLILSFNVSAQQIGGGGQSSVSRSSWSNAVDNGFLFGVDYINFTESAINVEVSTELGTFESSSSGRVHAGFTGFHLGYANTPVYGFGYGLQAAYIKSLNQSEVGSRSISTLIPQANLTMGMGNSMKVFVGINTGLFVDYKELRDTYKPDVGGQAGIGFRVGSVNFDLGYLLTRYRVSGNLGFGQISGNMSLGGFISSLSFVF